MTKEQLNALRNLEKDVETSKNNGLFDIKKIIEEGEPLVVEPGKCIKRYKDFVNIDMKNLPQFIRSDDDLWSLVWHFQGIEEYYKMENEDQRILRKIGLVKVNFTASLTFECDDIKLNEDHYKIKNLFDFINYDKANFNIGEHTLEELLKALTTKQKQIVNYIHEHPDVEKKRDIAKALGMSETSFNNMYSRIIKVAKNLFHIE